MNKGDRPKKSVSRGFFLFAVSGRVLAKMLSRRVAFNFGEKLRPESQCGFRPGRGTCHMMFVTGQLQEKCREQHVGLHMVFVDHSKAFDCVPRELLWNILKSTWCPDRIVSLLKRFYDNMKVRVSTLGTLSKEFDL